MDFNILEMTNNLTQNLEKENSVALVQEQNRFFETTVRTNCE